MKWQPPSEELISYLRSAQTSLGPPAAARPQSNTPAPQASPTLSQSLSPPPAQSLRSAPRRAPVHHWPPAALANVRARAANMATKRWPRIARTAIIVIVTLACLALAGWTARRILVPAVSATNNTGCDVALDHGHQETSGIGSGAVVAAVLCAAAWRLRRRARTQEPRLQPSAISHVDTNNRTTGVSVRGSAQRSKMRRACVAATSITGRVRTENQDRTLATRISGADVLIVADGMGGLPNGGDAADIVVMSAVLKLQTRLPEVVTHGPHAVRAALIETIWHAGAELSRAVPFRGEGDRLRTTLIVCVALPDAYVCAWIGDGGITLARVDGTLIELLDPHKDRDVPSILHCSLGPATDGRPSWSMIARRTGDLLVVATDGIADTLGSAVACVVRRELRTTRGNLDQAVRKTVEALGRATDQDGRIWIDDNLTAAAIATPTSGGES